MSWETSMLLAVQRRTAGPRTLPVARLLSRAGEHAAAWIAVGLVGATLDARARPQWVQALLAVVASHGSSVVLKRVVRRVRPTHASLAAHVAVPSRWSFPSSHAASTTTAAIVYGRLLGTRVTAPVPAAMALVPAAMALVPAAMALVPAAMAWSRLALGVHHPSDVLSGAALGTAVAAVSPIGGRTGRGR